MSDPEVCVVVATHDAARWRFLHAAVESVLGQDLPARLVVAVDHNPLLQERISRTWPSLEVVPNRHEPGASGTRNAGAERAREPVIAFLDDDAVAHPGWLRRLVAPLAGGVGPDPVVGTGGGVTAAWSAGKPRWFPDEFAWAVGASYRGMPSTTAMVRNVWSENMAVRRDVFDAVGGFRLHFGKVGRRSRPEDTDLCIRMAAAVPSGRWIYVPDALATHHVPRERSTFSFFVRRSFLEGRGKIEMSRLLGPHEKLDSERDYLRRTLPRGVARGLAAATRGQIDGLLMAGAIATGVAAAGAGAAAALLPPTGGSPR